MDRQRARLLVCAIGAVGLILASSFLVSWFKASIGLATMGVQSVNIDLRAIQACSAEGVCVSLPMKMLTGMYPTAATAAFWSSMLVAGLVAYQAGTRLLDRTPSERLEQLGYVVTLLALLAAGLAGYLASPATGSNAAMSLTVERTWGPAMLLVGHLVSFVALFLAGTHADLLGSPTPSVRVPEAIARSAPARAPEPARSERGQPVVHDRVPDSIPLDDSPVVREPRTKGPTAPPEVRIKSPTIPADVRIKSTTAAPDLGMHIKPAIAEGRVKSSTADPDVNVRIKSPTASPDAGVRIKSPTASPDAGVRIKSPTASPDVRGKSPTVQPILIDLPPPRAVAHASTARPAVGGPPSIELGVPASTAPAALRDSLHYAVAAAELTATGIEAHLETGGTRLVTWADLVGVVARRLPPAPPFNGSTFVDLVSSPGATLRILPWTRLTGEPLDGDDRARALVQLVATRCAGAKLDGATRTFLGSHGPAVQLPDAATLAAHDARLA